MSDGMEVACACDYGDYDEPRFYSAIWPRARKQHVCCECGAPIAPGTIYERVKALWPDYDRPVTYATCVGCARMRQDWCAPHEGLRETIQDKLGFDYVDDDFSDFEENQP